MRLSRLVLLAAVGTAVAMAMGAEVGEGEEEEDGMGGRKGWVRRKRKRKMLLKRKRKVPAANVTREEEDEAVVKELKSVPKFVEHSGFVKVKKMKTTRAPAILQHQKENEVETEREDERRQGRFFSLFSVVSFNNAGCTSTTTSSSGIAAFRNGTCYTSTECANLGGTSSGTCASGFGVCCVFVITDSTITISQNCTYIQNPGFPASLTTTTGLQYTVAKCDNSVCSIRLDFETFTLLGPAGTAETNGGACQDTFIVTVPTGQQIPTICGQNTGQHIYIDVGANSGDSATLAFAFSGTNNIRQWDIKATQVPCASAAAPPPGCLQYTTGLTGRLTSFNFLDATGSSHLANQRYSQCIRQEAGYCCVQFQACTDANSFTIDATIAAAGTSLVDTQCTLDYITIPTSSSQCMPGTGVMTRDAYCGNFFNPFTGIALNGFTCDCTPPFQVGIRTDAAAEANSITAGNNNRGVCLTYNQLPCN